jgi:hypothetical protein
MTDNEYTAVLEGAFKRLMEAATERNNLEAEIAKLRQFILATMPMLSEEDQESFRDRMIKVNQSLDAFYVPLSGAVYNALHIRDWMTVTQVRDQLRTSGFDFSQYKASPLASISTTLKRLYAKGEVQRTMVDGSVAAYRLKAKRNNVRRLAKKIM